MSKSAAIKDRKWPVPHPEWANINRLCVSRKLRDWSDDPIYDPVAIKQHDTGISCNYIVLIAFSLNTPLENEDPDGHFSANHGSFQRACVPIGCSTLHFSVTGRAATNTYFNYWLICWLFSRFIDLSFIPWNVRKVGKMLISIFLSPEWRLQFASFVKQQPNTQRLQQSKTCTARLHVPFHTC